MIFFLILSFLFIFPVNESIWEHMKILFTSTLIYSLIEYILLKKYNITYNNLPFNTYFIPLMQIPLYLVIYIPLYKLLGESMFISITLMIIVYIIGQIVSYNILKEKELKSIKYTFSSYNNYNISRFYLFNL